MRPTIIIATSPGILTLENNHPPINPSDKINPKLNNITFSSLPNKIELWLYLKISRRHQLYEQFKFALWKNIISNK